MPFDDVAVRGQDEIDEVLAENVDQPLADEHGDQQEGIAAREQPGSQVVDPVLEGEVDLEQVRVPGQEREVDGAAFPARDPVPDDSLDLANVRPIDERDGVMPSGADVVVDHLSEAGEHAELLLLDDVEAAAEHEEEGDRDDAPENLPMVLPEEVESGVDDASARLQFAHRSTPGWSGISPLSRYLNSSLSAGSIRVVFRSMMRS